jgi:anhydro-N-acetylmuramic acid kinase
MKRETINKYHVIGLMSGTSLDGIDVASCYFEYKKKCWHFSIEAAQTLSYSSQWKEKLSQAHLLSGSSLITLHMEYGRFLGETCNQFIKKNQLKKIELIASHGHTVFHQPKNKFTFQLGDGNAIHSSTQIPVAFDFRSLDVALGGQGAPLVPIGDQLLFKEYGVCLNLGGIANVSLETQGKRNAFDICYCNLALNFLSNQIGKSFDKNGKLSSEGKVNEALLSKLKKAYLNSRKKRPSLAREEFEKVFMPLIMNNSISINDRLRTVSESIANEIASAIPTSKKKLKLLITGGGAHNHFLIETIQKKLSAKAEIIIPDKIIIDFKEALVFAFLGVLRLRGETNVLKNVTGAPRDSCSGVLIGNIF